MWTLGKVKMNMNTLRSIIKIKLVKSSCFHRLIGYEPIRMINYDPYNML